jgi:predicted MFS family arabinose efflux permease
LSELRRGVKPEPTDIPAETGAEHATMDADNLNSQRMRAVTVTLAFTCGAAIANVYYAQPLLDLISHSFHVSQGSATIAVTATQVGFALGLVFVLPLGDLLEVRNLALRTLILTAVALGAAAAAPNLGVFLGVSVFVGASSVVAQILVPFAAHLAPPAQRGKFIGRVMSGLLLGILLARSIASLTAAAWGWRSIYAISAGLMLVTCVAIWRYLPSLPTQHESTYPRLIRSVGQLLRAEPVLRQRALAQACMFATFTAYWTGITYELIDEHGLNQTGIAVFALAGAAGAAVAPIAGLIGDRGLGLVGRGANMLLACVAMLVACFGHSHLVLLAVAGVVVDAAVQGNQVLSQRDIYALDEHARARINAGYMGTIFGTGAIASALTGVLHAEFGWSGVAIFGAVMPMISFIVLWLPEALRSRRNRRREGCSALV